ncbi:YczE/YyaS/YitT family protein [Salinibacillus xinjiangensis]|nr:YitT family protein [Salinibacillus xinjiangensis]
MTDKQQDSIWIRWSFYIIGIMALAFGISLMIKAKDLGIGPWDVFHYGLYLQFGLTVGTWSILAGLVIVTISCVAMKMWPKIGTILNMVFVGVFIDIFLFILPDPGPIWMDILTLIVGLVVCGYGVGLYVAANLGAGPRDSLMLFLTEKFGWKVQWVRSGIEVFVLITGYLLGGPVGVGTIVASLALGPIVGYTLPQSKRWIEHVQWRRKRSENFNQGEIRFNHYDCTGEESR